jgi:hypothetical protein
MAETAIATTGGIEPSHQLNLRSSHWCQNKLGNPITTIDKKGFLTQINQTNAHLPSIIGINGPWAIDYCHPVPDCQAASWPDLQFISHGNGD